MSTMGRDKNIEELALNVRMLKKAVRTHKTKYGPRFNRNSHIARAENLRAKSAALKSNRKGRPVPLSAMSTEYMRRINGGLENMIILNLGGVPKNLTKQPPQQRGFFARVFGRKR